MDLDLVSIFVKLVKELGTEFAMLVTFFILFIKKDRQNARLEKQLIEQNLELSRSNKDTVAALQHIDGTMVKLMELMVAQKAWLQGRASHEGP